jgi:DNA-binding transcriptional ArsR family regulator
MAERLAARETIIQFLNTKVGEEVTVDMICSITGINGRVVRRHLRKLRDRYPESLQFTIQGGRLVYRVLKPIPLGVVEAEEEISTPVTAAPEVEEESKVEKTIEEAAERKRKGRRSRKKKTETEVQEELEGL